MGEMAVLAGIVLLIGFIILMRFIGAWMLRINDVISNQEKQLQKQDEIINKLRGIDDRLKPKV
jgi:uncharacterized membrane protein YciS (DUF1049 family)